MRKSSRLWLCLLVCGALAIGLACRKDEEDEDYSEPETTEMATGMEMTTEPMDTGTTDMTTEPMDTGTTEPPP